MTRRTILRQTGWLAAAVAGWSVTGHSKRRSEDKGLNDRNLKVAESYLAAWQRKDLNGIGEHVHPDVHFKTPSADLKGKEAFLQSARRILPILISFDIQWKFASGDHVVAIYNFNCVDPVGTCRTAELLTFKEGQIAEAELFFDPRPFAKLAQPKN